MEPVRGKYVKTKPPENIISHMKPISKTFALATGIFFALANLGAQPALKDVFKNDFLIGAALNQSQFTGANAIESALVKQQFNTITPENVLKWYSIHPALDRYDFAMGDRYVEFGESNGMFIIGHTLIWHEGTPKWAVEDSEGKPISREVLLQRMHDHIFTVVGRYQGRVKGWDVVNEAVDGNGLRASPWLKILGEDYLLKAYQFTHEADPQAELYYNDYGLEDPKKRAAAIALIKNLQSHGVKLTAVGLQGHYGLKYPDISQVDATISDFAALGIKVNLTELDVNVLPEKQNPYTNGLPDSVQRQLASRYAELFAVFLKHQREINRVTFWGVTDAGSWLNSWPVRGRANYPLLFDRQGKPKPAFDAVIQVAGGTKSGLAVDEQGTLRFQGEPFRGIGVNFYDAFTRTLGQPARTDYGAGFQELAARKIPFARFSAGGYWPNDWALYQTNRAEYFARLDGVVQSAEKHGIGLIPSCFWCLSTVPDLVGEPCNRWGDTNSRTIAFMREYTRELVTRYASSSAIWGWEFGNEYNLPADLPNAAEHRPPVVPGLGTPAKRTAEDDITQAEICVALREFALVVRKYDPARIIISGNAFPRMSAWHQAREKSWQADTPEQFAEVLAADNPSPINTLCVRGYDLISDIGRLDQAMRVSQAVKKPLFMGEFGVPGYDTDKSKAPFAQIITAIETNRVPMAALWVFDFDGQAKDWNVNATNGRNWQLDMVQEANARMRTGH